MPFGHLKDLIASEGHALFPDDYRRLLEAVRRAVERVQKPMELDGPKAARFRDALALYGYLTIVECKLKLAQGPFHVAAARMHVINPVDVLYAILAVMAPGRGDATAAAGIFALVQEELRVRCASSGTSVIHGTLQHVLSLKQILMEAI